MASIYTHIYFVKKLIKDHNLKNINIKWAISGAVTADIDFLGNITKNKYELQKFWHKENYKNKESLGIDFAKKLLKESSNNKERSYAFGFLSHFILDTKIHCFLDKKNIKDKDHIEIEYYIDKFFVYEKLKTKFPKKLIIKTLDKYYKKHLNYKNVKKILKEINYFTILRFKFTCYIIKKLAQKRYIDDPKKDLIIHFILKIISTRNPLVLEIYNPNIKLKKYNKYLINKIIEAEELFNSKYIDHIDQIKML